MHLTTKLSVLSFLLLVPMPGGLSDSAQRLHADEKPVDKPEVVQGIVESVAGDGKSIVVKTLPKKPDNKVVRLTLKISDQTKLSYEKVEKAPKAGYAVEFQLEKGSMDRAVALRFRSVDKAPGTKPTGDGDNRPSVAVIVESPNLKEYVVPKRDPAPFAALIDEHVDRVLAEEKIPVSGIADDAEFLRRVTLDLTGRVPSYQRTVAFLASNDPHKRRNLVEDLLTRQVYGEHFATIWRNLIVGPSETGKERSGRDTFHEWLREQFLQNHGWNEIAAQMLTAEGPITKTPPAAFAMAHAENQQPQPGKLADATARLFWGIQLRCAECHDHPFAQWKQKDFWATAAFFSRLRNSGRGEGPTLTESNQGGVKEVSKGPKPVNGAPPEMNLAGGILIPATAGKNGGKVIMARFLDGADPQLAKDGPYRPRFAAWATGADNPYFARAAVNRWWAHFFGRGMVEPVDNFDESNPASHPELLDKLAREFAASGFDLKHLCRIITSSKAYQRTSRAVEGNADDKRAYSHMAVKPLSPEAFFDSITVVTGGGASGAKSETRAAFIKALQPLPESGVADSYQQGIPQLLKLFNTPLLNQGAQVVNTLGTSNKSPAEAIEILYLTALSRQPTETEVRLMTRYLEGQSNPRDGYAGVLWILLNSSEFALNH